MKTPKTFNRDGHAGIRTHVIPIFYDWTAADVWRLIRPNLYEEGGTIHMKPLERVPDGEPMGYTSILTAHGKHYFYNAQDDDCHCDVSESVCKHWTQIRD